MPPAASVAPLNACAPGVKKDRSGSCLPASARVRGCVSDLCSAKKLGDRGLLARLRPEMPEAWRARPRALLDTNNINDVMTQYERQYPHFKYLRTLPIDAFAAGDDGRCVVAGLCRVDVAALKRAGKRIVGAVMNLDKHDRPGSHWVSFAIDTAKAAIYYYDSFGRPPPRELCQFFGRVRALAPAKYTRNSVYNAVRHQHKNTECGVFACLALEALLRGTSFAAYCSKGLTDEDAFAQRSRLFSAA